MKTCFKFTFVLFMLLSAGRLPAQHIDLEKLPENRRDSMLIEIAKAGVLKYGPGYWRDYKDTGIQKPEIKYRTLDPIKDESITVSYPELKGKKIYTVKFFYDKTKERLSENFAAHVRIVAETATVSDIWFGNSIGIGVYHEEIGKNKTRSGSKHGLVPYQQAPDRPQIHPKTKEE